MMTDYESIVRSAASGLRLLDEAGELMWLDSFALLDLVEVLERTTGLSIPTAAITTEHFKSIAAVVGMLRERGSEVAPDPREAPASAARTGR